ncbi:hypothetical protein BLOT_007588 [Blomia tropicalis]|nr:hypothetical protein BLOT_007588 [Blomia tropicalis]
MVQVKGVACYIPDLIMPKLTKRKHIPGEEIEQKMGNFIGKPKPQNWFNPTNSEHDRKTIPVKNRSKYYESPTYHNALVKHTNEQNLEKRKEYSAELKT